MKIDVVPYPTRYPSPMCKAYLVRANPNEIALKVDETLQELLRQEASSGEA